MIISSSQEMVSLGVSLSQHHKKILLIGELAAGKTTFSQGFASGLSIDPQQVQSPTYTYMNIYEDKLLHIDMYRLEEASQLLHLGILEEIEKYPYVLIEWPKRTEEYMDDEWLKVEIEKVGENEREVIIVDYKKT